MSSGNFSTFCNWCCATELILISIFSWRQYSVKRVLWTTYAQNGSRPVSFRFSFFLIRQSNLSKAKLYGNSTRWNVWWSSRYWWQRMDRCWNRFLSGWLWWSTYLQCQWTISADWYCIMGIWLWARRFPWCLWTSAHISWLDQTCCYYERGRRCNFEPNSMIIRMAFIGWKMTRNCQKSQRVLFYILFNKDP